MGYTNIRWQARSQANQRNEYLTRKTASIVLNSKKSTAKRSNITVHSSLYIRYGTVWGFVRCIAINQRRFVMPGRSRSPGRGRLGDIQCRKSRQLLHLCCSGEFYLGFPRSELQGVSWYRLLHWESTREAQTKHRLSKYYDRSKKIGHKLQGFCLHASLTHNLLFSSTIDRIVHV